MKFTTLTKTNMWPNNFCCKDLCICTRTSGVNIRTHVLLQAGVSNPWGHVYVHGSSPNLFLVTYYGISSKIEFHKYLRLCWGDISLFGIFVNFHGNSKLVFKTYHFGTLCPNSKLAKQQSWDEWDNFRFLKDFYKKLQEHHTHSNTMMLKTEKFSSSAIWAMYEISLLNLLNIN